MIPLMKPVTVNKMVFELKSKGSEWNFNPLASSDDFHGQFSFKISDVLKKCEANAKKKKSSDPDNGYYQWFNIYGARNTDSSAETKT